LQKIRGEFRDEFKETRPHGLSFSQLDQRIRTRETHRV
jgi:hypothetical protein